MTKERVLHLTKKDFIMQTFRAGGKGGQKQNKTNSGVRFIHPPSGARGESRDHRTQAENKKTAFQRMADSREFRAWLNVEHTREVQRRDSWLDEQMKPENLTIEYGKAAHT